MLLFVLGLMMPFSLVGLFVCYHILRGQRPPADSSNRIAKIRLVWFALTRENLFVGRFPWLGRDELENSGGR